ncbi:MAG TPA: hypothetical protein VK459_23400 [Polyangiaceae bacterium]|nr:hypothetical protein [Polyangiaceae bacterium]
MTSTFLARAGVGFAIGLIGSASFLGGGLTAAGWTNVLPKNLHILPPEDGGFWIPASDVPK